MSLLSFLNQKKRYLLKRENIYFILLIITIFSLDRLSKIEIINNFSDTNYYINNFINLNLIWNTGIGFGLMSSDSSLFYNIVTILVGSVILILFYVTILSESLDRFIYSIIIGGAFGNFYDRLTYSAVPDFIDLHFNNFHWFTFNVADIFITLGIMAFIIKGFFVNKLKDEKI
jgi:signal peptidase II